MAGLDLVKIKLVKDRRLGDGKLIANAEDVAEFLTTEMQDLDREHLYVLNLNAKCRVINGSLVSMGTLDGAPVHPREILKTSILSNASSFIIAHNHPSGDTTPSKADREACKNINAAAELMGIRLLDFVIVGNEDNYYSFAKYGEMPIVSKDEAKYLIDKLEKPKEVKSNLSIERVIDGIPYKFNLTEDEVKEIYTETIESLKQDIRVKIKSEREIEL